MKIAVIGTGLIGCERIEALQLISKATNNKITISSIFDTNQDTLLKAQHKYQVSIAKDLSSIFQEKPDWVFIATPNDVVKDITKQAFEIGANVLMEKPFGRSLAECEEIIRLKPSHCKLHIGFNYRFFDGIEAALHDTKSGKFGQLISVNLVLGHGNSPGMEKSWRFQPSKGGDCATDLGVHLFDLILQLSSYQPSIKFAKSWSGFWNTGIEEEFHFIAIDNNGTIFNGQTSLNRWRSTFRMEINGTEGYGIVEGRGRSHGSQSYRTGKRWGWLTGQSQAASETLIIENNDCSNSFIKETMSILGISHEKYSTISTPCTYQEAKDIMTLLEQSKRDN